MKTNKAFPLRKKNHRIICGGGTRLVQPSSFVLCLLSFIFISTLVLCDSGVHLLSSRSLRQQQPKNKVVAPPAVAGPHNYLSSFLSSLFLSDTAAVRDAPLRPAAALVADDQATAASAASLLGDDEAAGSVLATGTAPVDAHSLASSEASPAPAALLLRDQRAPDMATTAAASSLLEEALAISSSDAAPALRIRSSRGLRHQKNEEEEEVEEGRDKAAAAASSPLLPTTANLLDHDHGLNSSTTGTIPLDHRPRRLSLESSAWPKYRGNVQNTGQSIYSGPMGSSLSATTLFASSSQSLSFAQVTSPSIDGSGNIYFFGCISSFICNYLVSVSSSGSYLWHKFLSSANNPLSVALYSSPAIGNDGTIYVCTTFYGIVAISSSGSITWSGSTLGTGKNGVSSPTIDSSGNIYYISYDANDCYLNVVTNTGTLTRSCTIPNSDDSYSTPAISSDGSTIYINTGNGYVYAFSTTSCTTTWNYNSGDVFNAGSVAVGASGTIYTGSVTGYLYAISSTGTLTWSFSTGNDLSYSTPAISSSDESIYVTDNTMGYLFSISKLGTLKWTYTSTTGAASVSSPIIGFGGTAVYFTSTSSSISTLYGISSSGTKLCSIVAGGDLSYSDPAIGSNGALYVVDTTGLYSIANAPTGQPSGSPTQPSSQPSAQPSKQPTSQPSIQPSRKPSSQPSLQPTSKPSKLTPPTSQPTRRPSSQPSHRPTSQPSSQPSTQPTYQPSSQPSSQPSMQPTSRPSTPTTQPSSQPSRQPSSQPSTQPTSQPSVQPSSQPSQQPTSQPTTQPSMQPTSRPTTQPSTQPSRQPTTQPSAQPSSQPSVQPTSRPTTQPSTQPSRQPTTQPSAQPSSQPSVQPTTHPTIQPTKQPTSQPSTQPTTQPSERPTEQPTKQPTALPSSQPTRQPSAQPSAHPSVQPSRQPSSHPSRQPTGKPTTQPSSQPSVAPSSQPSVLPTAHPTVFSYSPTPRPTRVPTTRPSLAGDSPTLMPTALTPTSAVNVTQAIYGIPASYVDSNLQFVADGLRISVFATLDFTAMVSNVTILNYTNIDAVAVAAATAGARLLRTTGDNHHHHDVAIASKKTYTTGVNVIYQVTLTHSNFTSLATAVETAVTAQSFSYELSSQLAITVTASSVVHVTDATRYFVPNHHTDRTSSKSRPSNDAITPSAAGAIAGGVIGGVLLLLIILFCCIQYCSVLNYTKRRRSNVPGENDEQASMDRIPPNTIVSIFSRII